MKTIELEYDIVVVGGGTGGPMAAVKAKEKNPKLRVLLIDKANVLNWTLSHLATYVPNNVRLDLIASAQAELVRADTME